MADNKHGYNFRSKPDSPTNQESYTSDSKSSENLDTVDLHCPTLQEYLLAKPVELLEKLYEYPSICMAVYRELSEYGKHYVIRILYLDQPVPQAVITSWGMQQYAKEQTDATDLLKKLCIWNETSIPGGLLAWDMNKSFRYNLKVALLGNRVFPKSLSSNSNEYKLRDISFLDQYAITRWRSLLHYMVGNNAGIDLGVDNDISPDAVRILLQSNLMKREEGGISITRQGFQFLLLDTYSQVRYFMWEYLNSCEEKGLKFPETMSMLFKLSYTTLGRDCQSDVLNSKMLMFIQHLREFGLVFQRKRKEGRYYPTRLVHNIANFNSKLLTSIPCLPEDNDSGYIVVETNYRVYAYTSSPLQIAILALFTELLYHFSNMVVGILTRESVRQAFRGGLTANQILSYLEQYAHSKMKRIDNNNVQSILPPTIVDQIKLWELERNRLTFIDGIVYNQFLSPTDYKTLRDYAQSIGELVWENERSRTMVVTLNGHDDVKRYWKRYSKGA